MAREELPPAAPRQAPTWTPSTWARKLVDGEQIRIPARGQAATAAPPSGAPAAGPLDLSTATAEQLDTLPGVGEVTTGRIVAYCTAQAMGSTRLSLP